MKLLRQVVTDLREYTRANARGRASSARRLVLEATSDGFQVLALQRVRETVRALHVPLVNHLVRRAITMVYGMEIGNAVTLGDGVSFVHTLGTVIGGDAHIGARVRFMGNVTVGTAKDNGYPTIEHDVVIGAGARILGPIRIGHHAVIGANAVVLDDVPPGTVATGVPAVSHPKPLKSA